MLAAYLITVIGVITLAPFQFRIPDELYAAWIVLDDRWPSDLALNVVLFVPLGFTLRRIPTRRVRGRWWVLLSALAMSASIETAQLFLAPRFSTASDVVCNTFGAWLGAYLSDAIARRLGEGRALVGRLFLDLPLIGFVYVLVPLMWLDALAAGSVARDLWAFVPLACAGALALAAVAASGVASTPAITDRAELSSTGFGIAVALWYALGALPAVRVAPLTVAIGALLAPALALAARPVWRRAMARERRLEPLVVRVVLPLVLVYLAAIARRGGGELPRAFSGDLTRVAILRWLEGSAGYTALGYLVAEWRGRREEPLPRAAMVPVLIATLTCITLGMVLRGSVDLASLMISLGATALGVIAYGFQRAHIRALLGR